MRVYTSDVLQLANARSNDPRGVLVAGRLRIHRLDVLHSWFRDERLKIRIAAEARSSTVLQLVTPSASVIGSPVVGAHVGGVSKEGFEPLLMVT